MFVGITDNLPKTSYVKMIDIWLLFSLSVPFLMVVLHTVIDTQRLDENRTVNHHGRVRQVKPGNGQADAWRDGDLVQT